MHFLHINISHDVPDYRPITSKKKGCVNPNQAALLSHFTIESVIKEVKGCARAICNAPLDAMFLSAVGL